MANFGDILSSLSIAAGQSVRRNAGDSAFEAYAADTITIGTTPIASGTNNRVLYQASGVVSQSANLTFDGTVLSVGTKAFQTDLALVNGSTYSASLGYTARITTDNAGRTPLQLVGVAAQSNPLLAIYDSGGVLNGRWDATGSISVTALTVTGDIGTSSGNSVLLGDTSAAGAGYYAFFRTGHVSRTSVIMRAITSQSNPILEIQDSGASSMIRFMPDGKVGIGMATPAAKFDVISTSEQLRIGYDASNYYKTTVGSTGDVTFDAVGSGAAFTFSDAVTVNGSLTLSAQNIVTDTTTGLKIGTGTTQKLGLWNATPVTQRSNIGAVTDNTGGTAGATIDAVTPGADTIDVSILHDTLATIAQRLNRIEQVFQDTGMTS